MAESAAPLIHPSRIINRWAQLVAGIIAMMAIANLQYAWTLFTKPMQTHLKVSLTAIQGIFSLFILLETWLVPFEGYLVDRIGPRLMLGVGGVLVGLSWIFSGHAETLRGLYFWYCVGGVGAGVVYGGTIGNALKWFPDHRGLCVGLTAGAYGIGTALTVSPIDKMIKATGYQHTLVFWGIIQGFVVLVAALFLANPPQAGLLLTGRRKKPRSKARAYFRRRHDPLADAAPALLLRHLPDDDHVVIRWIGRYRPTQPHGSLLPCRQSRRRFRHDCSSDGDYGGPLPERAHATVLGMGVRPYWP